MMRLRLIENLRAELSVVEIRCDEMDGREMMMMIMEVCLYDDVCFSKNY